MMFYFVIEMMDLPKTAQFFVCNGSFSIWIERVTEIKMFYTDYEKWKKSPVPLNNVKPIVFEHVELLELIYPTSDSCIKVNEELYSYIDRYNVVMDGTQNKVLIIFNGLKNLGTILSNVVQLDTCF